MKFRLFLLHFFFGLTFYAQESSNISIPNYAPKSPEAAAFLKYGDYPVNLSTGAVNISIPIYTIEAKDYKLPITLDYHASGIKVSQEASWVGLGWNLNFGATIILNVKEDVDENNSQTDNLPSLDQIMAYYANHPYQVTGGLIANQELDKPRVKDTYSFFSATGSCEFYIKNASSNPAEVVVYPPDSFKVEVINGLQDQPASGRSRFKVTDAAGNIYIFRTSEVSKHQNYGQMYNQGEYKSAWYVDEIRTPTNDVINFTYQDDGITDEALISQKTDIVKTATLCNCPEHYTYSEQVKPVVTMVNHTYTYIKRLKEITFNGGNSKLIFHLANGREDFRSGYNSNLAKNYCTSHLSAIEIRQKNSAGNFDLVRGFDFVYSYFNPNSGTNNYSMKRLKLDAVLDLLSGDGHNFQYYATALPSKDSYSKDLYGYYNNANNSNLIIPYAIPSPFTVLVGSAEREVNPAYAKAGVLVEVHYPTKGYTKFNYESNMLYGSSTQTYQNNISLGTGPYHPDIGYEPTPSDNNFPLYFSEAFTVNNGTMGVLTWTAKNNAGGQYSQTLFHPLQYVKATITKYNPDGTNTIVYDSGQKNGGPASSGFQEGIDTYTGNLSLMPGNYQLTLVCNGKNVTMSAGLSYTHSQTTNGNFPTAGLRIAGIENYDHNDVLLSKKIYDYSSPDDSSRSSGRKVNDLQLNFLSELSKHFTANICPIPQGTNQITPALDYVISRSILSNSTTGEEGNTVTYEFVTEKDINVIDQSSNGHTLYKFSVGADMIIDPTFVFGASWLRGKTLEVSNYKRAGSTSILLKKVVNNYLEDNSRMVNYSGFKMRRLATIEGVYEHMNPFETPVHLTLGDCGGIPSSVSSMVSFNEIDINIPWNYLKSKEITEYFYNSNNTLANTLVSTTEYVYSNPNHLQLSKQITTTSANETIETRYYYPGDAVVQSEPFMADLIARNMINTPVRTQNYLNGERISEQKTLFKSWPAVSGTLILPEVIQAAKGSGNLENRIVTVSRDLAGNPTEVKLENGISVSYIWGYSDSQPVAKIENQSYAGINSALISQIKAASTNGSEQELKNKLDQLRFQLADKMVTTYTYKPLIGLHTVTDPQGKTTTYEIDNQGRLRYVRDNEGNILTENLYHYKD